MDGWIEMSRILVIAFSLLLLTAPAHAALVTYDISGTARTGSSHYGVVAGQALSGSITFDDAVSHGKGATGDVSAFEFRVGDTVFDMDGGTFSASYELRDDDLFKLNVHAKPREFKKDKRQFLLNLESHGDLTLKLKDLGNDWIHVDTIAIARPSPIVAHDGFNADLSTVAEPTSLLAFAAGLGLLGTVGLRRRRTTAPA
jgi:hypothetical protein